MRALELAFYGPRTVCILVKHASFFFCNVFFRNIQCDYSLFSVYICSYCHLH